MIAVHEVRGLLETAITTQGFTSLTERDETDPVDESELPGVLLLEGDTDIEQIEGHAGGTITHATRFYMTFVTKGTREDAYDMMASLFAALLADWTLSGKVQEVSPQSYGGEEEMGRDYSAIRGEILVTFCTSNTDLTTLI